MRAGVSWVRALTSGGNSWSRRRLRGCGAGPDWKFLKDRLEISEVVEGYGGASPERPSRRLRRYGA